MVGNEDGNGGSPNATLAHFMQSRFWLRIFGLHLFLETRARKQSGDDQPRTISFFPAAQLSSLISHEADRDLTVAGMSTVLWSYRRCLDGSFPRICVTASLGFLPSVRTACCHFTLLFRYPEGR